MAVDAKEIGLPTSAYALFRPLPLLGNPHIQTVIGTLWRGAGVRLPTHMHVVPLADGDALALHDTSPPDWLPGNPVAMLVHGVGGSHRSAIMQRFANRFTAHGLRVFRLDLRGAGAGASLARHVYNAGCADDVRAAAEFIERQAAGSPLFVLGLSLGGNIVLNMAAEAAARPLPCLRAVAALSPPVDLVQCSAMLAKVPFYDRYFARYLRLQVEYQQARFPDIPHVSFPRSLGVRIFDELYTAPRGGFADALDYYRRTSSLPAIPHVAVPTLILSARDDPFIAVSPLEQLRGLSHLQLELSHGGGHLGFLGRDGTGGVRWAEKRVAEWIINQARPMALGGTHF